MKATVLYQDASHQWLIFGRDPDKPEKVIDTNQFLIRAGDEALLAEPGGVELFPGVLRAVLDHVDIDQITALFASHQDPDLISSLGLWDNVLPRGTLYAPWMWEGFIRHFGCDHLHYEGIPDQGLTIQLGGIELRMIPAHFLHSAGNFHLYDPGARILMSSDVGMALEPDQQQAGFFCEDFDSHVQYMEPLHVRWMPSRQAIRDWVARVRDLDIDLLVPHHGRAFQGEDVGRFLDWFERLEVGRTQ